MKYYANKDQNVANEHLPEWTKRADKAGELRLRHSQAKLAAGGKKSAAKQKMLSKIVYCTEVFRQQQRQR